MYLPLEGSEKCRAVMDVHAVSTKLCPTPILTSNRTTSDSPEIFSTLKSEMRISWLIRTCCCAELQRTINKLSSDLLKHFASAPPESFLCISFRHENTRVPTVGTLCGNNKKGGIMTSSFLAKNVITIIPSPSFFWLARELPPKNHQLCPFDQEELSGGMCTEIIVVTIGAARSNDSLLRLAASSATASGDGSSIASWGHKEPKRRGLIPCRP